MTDAVTPVSDETALMPAKQVQSSVSAAAGAPWRIIFDGAGDAAWNMALDEALLAAVELHAAPPTVRLYRWQRPAVTVGRFQNVARTVDVDVCAAHQIPLVRRLTGGRGILHGADLTVSVVGAVSDLNMGHGNTSVSAIYRCTAPWFLTALAAVGIEAREGVGPRVRGQEGLGDCFDVISQADIVDARTGKKVLGSALHRRSAYFLQQISIPLAPSTLNAVPIFRGGDSVRTMRPWATTSAKMASVEMAPETVRSARPISKEMVAEEVVACAADRLAKGILEALRAVYGETCIVDGPTDEERVAADRLVSERYRHNRWNLDGEVAALWN